MSAVPEGMVRITIETEKRNGQVSRSTYLTREVEWETDLIDKADPVFGTGDTYHDRITFNHEEPS